MSTQTNPRGAVAQDPAAAWRVSAALALAVPGSFLGYHAVLRENDWWLAIALTGAVVLAAAAGTRALIPERFGMLRALLPSTVAAIAAVVTVSLGSAPTTTFFGLPTPYTVEMLSGLAADGVTSLAVQEAPALAEPGVILLFTAGAAFVAVLCDLWAVAVRSPALAGLVLVPISIAPAFIVRIDSPLWIAVTIVLWLLVLAAGRPSRGRRGLDTLGVLGGALALALLAVGLAPLPSAVSSGDGRGAGSIRSGVNPVVTLGNDLRREETVTALHYSTASGEGHYLRLTAVDRFAPEGWMAPVAPNRGGTAERIGPPLGLSDEVARSEETTAVEISALGGSWLPVPYPVVAVEGTSRVGQWEADLQSVRLEGRSVRGEEYTATSLMLEPTAQQLHAAGTVVPPDLAPFTEWDASWPDIIAGTAASVTADASSNYERALALQQFLRAGDFVYSETAPRVSNYDDTSAGSVAAFLAVKSGYCVQFASAMAVMARTLGIPSRVALGFLPGSLVDTEADDARRVVTSNDLHAWPELYFEGIGWVPFEPTTQRGDVPEYAEPDALEEVLDAPTDAPDVAAPLPGASPSAPGTPDRADLDAGEANGVAERAGVPPVVLLALGLFALTLLPATARVLVRRRRWSLVEQGRHPELAWRELNDSARDLGVDTSELATPRANAATIAASMAPDAAAALARVLDAIERAAYAPAGPTAPRLAQDPAPPNALGDATREVLRALRLAASPRHRAIAALWPRSLVERLARLVS